VPIVVRRNLAVHFQRSVRVTSSGETPQSVEVTIIPLQDASNAAIVATYVGGPQSATATLLQDDNVVVFELVPSNFPGLSNPINYRIMWRVGGVTGRTETYDFAMPDVDVSFDQLQAIGNIIDGEAYLQQSDLGVAGRVAKLNNAGKVIDALGEPVATLSNVAAVQSALNTAVTNLNQQARVQHSAIYGTIDYKVDALSASINSTLQQAISGWSNSLAEENNGRVLADSNINSTLNSLSSAFTSSRSSLLSSISNINTALTTKADIDQSGYVPLSQIPPEAITNWIPLSSAAQRFSLIYPNDIQLGDLVLAPTGVYGLTGTDPSNPSSWYLLSQIQSVNNKTGAVILSAADVGALAVGASISQSQIAGLPSTLDGLATKTTTTSLQDQITTLRNDSTIVRLNSSGYVSHLLLNEYVAYVNVLGQITKKDGTVISDPATRGVLSVNGRSGTVTLTASDVGALSASALINQNKIDGLTVALQNKADRGSDGKVLVAQLPSIPQTKIDGLTDALLAKADLVGGVVPLNKLPSFPQSKITDLSALISGNQLTTNSNAINRISGLESRVSSIETTGGSGGGGATTAITSSVYWGGTSSNDVLRQDFISSVTLSSPFGIYSTGINAGKEYYNKNGVPSGDTAFPVVTPAGNLKLYKWGVTPAADAEYALASGLSTLSDTVRLLGIDVGKAALSSDLLIEKDRINSLNAAASNKADLDPNLKTLLPAQIPFSVKPNPKIVASVNAMKNLTTSQVHAGDTCIVTGVGTYTLLGGNPGAINNIDGWALHPGSVSSGIGTVVSISGPLQNKILPDAAGNIALQASDIGAATSSSLSNYVTSSEYTTGLSGKTNTNDVYAAIGSSQLVRTRVDYVVRQFTLNGQTYCLNGTGLNTTTIGTVTAPSGIQVIDKDPYNQTISAPQNALVLLTNQRDSKQNGIWKVNTGGQWSRPDDYLSGNKVFPGTLVVVNKSDEVGNSAGSANYTIWQNISLAVIDSNIATINGGTTWKNLGSIAPITISGENGISISGIYPDIRISSDSVSPNSFGNRVGGSGAVGGSGLVRYFTTTTTPTSPTYTITHGLNTAYPQVTVIEAISGAAVLVGWKVDPPSQTTNRYDSITLEFSSDSYASSYRISVQG